MADDVECQVCQRLVLLGDAFVETADPGYWEQRWFYCSDCAPEGAVRNAERG